MKLAGRFHYVHSCPSSTYEDIRALMESERSVELATFRKAVGPEQWRETCASLGYDRGFPISKDWHVRYYKGVYRHVPAYFLRHSRIEHIFTLDGKVGPSHSEDP
jgi:hypothetical protein